ncbi:MAG: molecular chaperone DnaJ [Alphaproteobacteria bacterium]|nr:molecular chaperone DnaJ [Alphaproteobacteria bacterium]
MAKRDYYEALGVDRGAADDEIKKSYRKLAMQFHPDRNPDDKDSERKFKEISEAYDVLKDPEKRAAYDRFGHAAFDGGGAGAGGRGGGFDFGGGFADIFDEMFGEFTGARRGGGRQRTRGNDLRFDLEVSLEDAFSGKQAKIRVPTAITCDACKGTGAQAGSQPANCATCQGAGRVRASQGFFTVERTCPACQGAGQVIENPCGPCSGQGRVTKNKSLSVNIPAGIEDGTRIRLAGEGEAGQRDGPPGDLYIFLTVPQHRFFQRDGSNLHSAVPVEMTKAALGGTIDVPTVDGGRARVTIPAGTQSDHQFRLKGKGMSIMRSGARGDMFVHVRIETPVNLTREQKELLDKFAQLGAKSGSKKPNSPEATSFSETTRKIWDDVAD